MTDELRLASSAAQLPEWITGRVEFFLAHTTRCATPHVPEIALHLGSEAVPLWDAIERQFGPAAAKAPPMGCPSGR
jgi:hypothetical protein